MLIFSIRAVSPPSSLSSSTILSFPRHLTHTFRSPLPSDPDKDYSGSLTSIISLPGLHQQWCVMIHVANNTLQHVLHLLCVVVCKHSKMVARLIAQGLVLVRLHLNQDGRSPSNTKIWVREPSTRPEKLSDSTMVWAWKMGFCWVTIATLRSQTTLNKGKRHDCVIQVYLVQGREMEDTITERVRERQRESEREKE